ncbi:hypothetical protein EB796_020464 [Bugula neritina]|uniref:Uncharacterized protein n=1 Tax=Bugula neritina TaxID=10212 RepID=A0A7J7J4V9_BUGNE|nr:hypothetical protein EB796_020464 [Bugula neritina]
MAFMPKNHWLGTLSDARSTKTRHQVKLQQKLAGHCCIAILLQQLRTSKVGRAREWAKQNPRKSRIVQNYKN